MEPNTNKKIVVLITLTLVFLAACETPLDCDVGIQGVSASFTDKGSLRTLEQNISMPIVVSIRNQGASPANGIVRLGYNQDLVRVSPDSYSFSDLSGKESWNRCQGQEERAIFTANPYPLPVAAQRFETGLTLDVCYEYRTNFSTTVCVDPRAQGINVLDPNCVPQERRFSGGQGAPLSIIRVAPVTYQDSHDGTARIRFTLQNHGDGRIVTAADHNLEQSCSIGSGTIENYIAITGFLDNEELDCTELNPGFETTPQRDNIDKTFLRPDPERVETRDGMITLRTFTFVCTAQGLDLDREMDMQVTLDFEYFYRDTRSDSMTTELRKI